MCHLCEARGSVGSKYRETQDEINRGLKAWRQSCGSKVVAPLRADLTKAPPPIANLPPVPRFG